MGKINLSIVRISMVLLLALMFVILIDVTARYFFNNPTIWAYDMSYILGGVMSVLAFGYQQSIKGNTRVDVIYLILPRKAQLIIDSVLSIFLYLPSFACMVYAFISKTRETFLNKEEIMHTLWRPKYWPIELLITVGYTVFIITFLIHIILDVMELAKRIRNKEET
jgi:TRAP-type mannitol/chloroaromatic compound transport system permease small subunit